MTASPIILAPCPHCGGKTAAELTLGSAGKGSVRHRVVCDFEPDDCGYRGPFAIDLADAVRAHNKISQNCGACNPLVSTAEKRDRPADSRIPNPVSHTAKPPQAIT